MPLASATTLLLLLQAAPTAPPPEPEAPPSTPSPSPYRRLVIANHYGLTWSYLSGVPSGEVSVFLGSPLRPRRSLLGRAWKTALGYEVTGSLGGADYSLAFFSWGGDYGIAYHRHHLAALGYGGPSDRLYYHFGGGVLLWKTTPIALEADIRLGVVLGVRRGARIKGVVGGQFREVAVLSGRMLPTLGVFAGFFVF